MSAEVILVLVILGGSVVLQFWAAGVALSLIGRVGLRNNWLLIALAIGLMAARRMVSFSHAWTVQDGDIQTILAEIIALATSGLLVMGLHNLHPHVQNLYKDNDVLSQLNDELQEKNRQLQKFNTFIAKSLHVLTRQTVSHVNHLQHNDSDSLKKHDCQNKLAEECATINDLANGLLLHIRASNDSKHKESVYFSSLVREIAENLFKSKNYKSSDLTVNDDIFIEADPYMLRNFSENLIRLAIKGGHETSSASLSEEFSNTPDRYYTFRFSGRPFTESELQNLYTPFSGLSNYHDLEKRGLELSLLSSIVHHYGGRIWLETERDSVFSINFTFSYRYKH